MPSFPRTSSEQTVETGARTSCGSTSSVDHGISGTKGRERRPPFEQLARDACGGKLAIVAAWSIERVGTGLWHLCLHQQQVDTSTATARVFLQTAGIVIERLNAGPARARVHGSNDLALLRHSPWGWTLVLEFGLASGRTISTMG